MWSKKTGRAYDPEANRKYKSELKGYLKDAAQAGLPVYPKHVPVRLSMKVFLKRPLIHFKGRKRIPSAIKEEFRGHQVKRAATVKKDLDNYAKMVMDSANGVIYYDDSQVVELVVSKRYDTVDECLGRTLIKAESK